MDIIPDGPPLETPEPSATATYTAIPPPFGQYLGTQVGSTVRSLGRVVARGAYAGADWFSQWLYGAGAAEAGISGVAAPQPGTAPAGPMLSPKDYNERFAPNGPDGNPVSLGSEPMSEAIAQSIGNAKREEIERENVMARWEGAHSWPTNFAAGALGFVLDPLRAATAFVPGIGEEAILARLGTGIAARIAARLTAGAITGTAAQAPLSALEYGLSQEEAGDYDLRSTLRDTMFAAAGNAIIHAGIVGPIRDLIRSIRKPSVSPEVVSEYEIDATKLDAERIMTADAQTKQAAMASAVGQAVEGRPIEVEPMFQLRTPEPPIEGGPTFLEPPPRPRRPTDPATVVAEQREQAITGTASGVPTPELRQATADVYEQKPLPAGEAEREAEKREEDRKKAAEAPPEGAPEPGRPPMPVPAGEQLVPELERKTVEGLPGTVYRGYGRTDQAAAYNPNLPASRPIMGEGRYYALTPEAAREFGPEIEELETKFTNPLVIRSDDEWQALTKEAGWKFPNPFGASATDLARLISDLNNLIRKRGHDAVVAIWNDASRGDFDGGRRIKTLRNVLGKPQVFVPEQERSAIQAAAAPKETSADTELAAAQQRAVQIAIDHAGLSPELREAEGAELRAAQEAMRASDKRAAAIDEAAACMKEAGA